ncbi:VanW family protein [Bacillaceae bacterium IKA-2]|nr:VanW family protein [Bacillaceae bacterium IKA-2]
MASNMLKIGFKLFSLVLLCTFFLIGFSIVGSYAYEMLYPEKQLIEQGTLVSSISIGELTNKEALQLIENETEIWGEANMVTFHYMDTESTKVASELISFDTQTTLQLAATNKITPIFVVLNNQAIDELLHQLSFVDLRDMIDQDLLNEDLIAYAQTLTNDPLAVDINNYLLEEYQEESGTIATSYIHNLSPGNDLNELIRNLNGYKINPKEEISFLSMLEEVNFSLNNNETMSIAASAIYKVILETNFEVIERHTSSSLPEYSELGYEAYVSSDGNDLRFYNPNSKPYTLVLRLQGKVLSAAIEGYPLANSYIVNLKDEQTFKPKRILQYSAGVPLGNRVIQQEGKYGYAIKVYREAYDRSNRIMTIELISEDFYRPTHIIEVRSLILTETSNRSNSSDLDQGITNPSTDQGGNSSGDNGSETFVQDENPSGGNGSETTDQDENSSDGNGSEIDDDTESEVNDPIKGY